MNESHLERLLADRSRELIREMLDGYLRMRARAKTRGPVREAGGEARTEYARPGQESLHPLDSELNLPHRELHLAITSTRCRVGTRQRGLRHIYAQQAPSA